MTGKRRIHNDAAPHHFSAPKKRGTAGGRGRASRPLLAVGLALLAGLALSIRPPAAAAATLTFQVTTTTDAPDALGALLVSLTVGLFGFRESISASYVVQSLTVETITALALIGWTALATSHPSRRLAPATTRPAKHPKLRKQSAEGNRAH